MVGGGRAGVKNYESYVLVIYLGDDSVDFGDLSKCVTWEVWLRSSRSSRG